MTRFAKRKKWLTLSDNNPRPHAHFQSMRKKPAKFQTDSWKTVGGVAHTSDVLIRYSDAEKRLSSWSNKNYLTIISRSHAHLQTMKKKPAKFQNDSWKTVGGDAHTRYLLLRRKGTFLRKGGGQKVKLMLMLLLIRVAEWPPIWKRAIHSVYRACLSWTFILLCVCFIPFLFWGMDVGFGCISAWSVPIFLL